MLMTRASFILDQTPKRQISRKQPMQHISGQYKMTRKSTKVRQKSLLLISQKQGQTSQPYVSGRTRWWNNMKSRQEAVSTATVVRPTLEYACPAWSTSLTLGLQSDMERVQRRTMNIIYPNTPYTETLANALLTSLKQKRAQLCEHFFTQIEEPQHKLHKLLPKPGIQHIIHDAALDMFYPD